MRNPIKHRFREKSFVDAPRRYATFRRHYETGGRQNERSVAI